MIDDGGGASRTTDPAAGTSAATDVSLREYLSQRIDALKELTEAHFAAMQQATDLALQAQERRFESVNEFRATLSDQAKHFVDEGTLNARVEKIDAAIARNREDVLALARRIDLREGQEQGSKITMGSLYAAFGVGIAILGLVIVLANYLTHH